MGRQTWTAIVSGALFVALVLAISLLPVNYVTRAPGSATNVLGQVNGQPVLQVSDITTYPTSGELFMTTVSITRVDARLNLPQAVLAYLLRHHSVLPREAVYPVGVTDSQVQAEESAAMQRSQQTAVAAALRAAGIPVAEVATVSSVVQSGPAFNRLQVGDVIEAIDGSAITGPADIETAIGRHAVGDLVQLDVTRDGASLRVSLTTAAANDDPRRPRIGIGVSTGYRYAPEISFGVDPAVGGPSAGLIFALGIYDQVTPDELLAGQSVAGTGEIDANGGVGGIGGIREKLRAADLAGAAVFLVPASNCAELEGVETDLRLVRVDELSDAIDSLKALQDPATADRVPGC